MSTSSYESRSIGSRKWLLATMVVLGLAAVTWVVITQFSRPCSLVMTPACIEFDQEYPSARVKVEVQPGRRVPGFLARCDDWQVTETPSWLTAERTDGDADGYNLELTVVPEMVGESADVVPVGAGVQALAERRVCLDWGRWVQDAPPCRVALSVSRVAPELELLPLFWSWEEPEYSEDDDGNIVEEDLFGEAEVPVVAPGSNGFLAVWAHEGAQGGNREGDDIDAAVVVRELSGGEMSRRLVLQETGDGSHVKPAAAGDDQGRYLVAWSAEDRVEVALVFPEDMVSGKVPEARRDGVVQSQGSVDDTAVVYDPGTGQWLVFWDVDGVVNDERQMQAAVYGEEQGELRRLHGEDFGLFTSKVMVDETTAALTANGLYLVVWADEPPEGEERWFASRVRAALFDPDREWPAPFAISPDDESLRSAGPALACRQVGDASECLVAWGSAQVGGEGAFDQLSARLLRVESGQVSQGETFTLTPEPGSYLGAGIAWAEEDRFLVSWSRETSGDSDVYIQWTEGGLSDASAGAASKVTIKAGLQSTRAEQPGFLGCAAGRCLVLWKDSAACSTGAACPMVKILGRLIPVR